MGKINQAEKRPFFNLHNYPPTGVSCDMRFDQETMEFQLHLVEGQDRPIVEYILDLNDYGYLRLLDNPFILGIETAISIWISGRSRWVALFFQISDTWENDNLVRRGRYSPLYLLPENLLGAPSVEVAQEATKHEGIVVCRHSYWDGIYSTGEHIYYYEDMGQVKMVSSQDITNPPKPPKPVDNTLLDNQQEEEEQRHPPGWGTYQGRHPDKYD